MWIKLCVSMIGFSILFNRKSLGLFQSTRELKMGDPPLPISL